MLQEQPKCAVLCTFSFAGKEAVLNRSSTQYVQDMIHANCGPLQTIYGCGGCVQVTQAAANIIQLRPPSVYKGKGIRLADTTPRLKPGKKK